MEIYLITCSKTDKYYVGSTSQTKEDRWMHQGWSHLNCAKNNDSRPLYEDIRKYGPDNFTLTTLEIVTDKSILISREDYWIKKYFQEYGSDRMYNMFPGAKITGDGHQLYTEEAIRNSVKTKLDRYNNAFYINEEGVRKRTEVHQRNHTSIYSRKAFENRSTEITYNDQVFYGVTEFYNYLLDNGYELSWNQVRRLALDGFFSKANTSKYPELVGSIMIRRKDER